jgi:trehalose/maltose transport system substrate-binding protein
VNNPRAIRAWQRAARWVGSISPPGVVGYEEWDAMNVWLAGDAAFMRGWPTAYLDSDAADSPIRNKFDISLLPGGSVGRMGTQGGAGLAISRSSAHPREALELVRYLSRGDVQTNRARALAQPPTLIDLYREPAVLGPNPRYALVGEGLRTGLVRRPSIVTGKNYQAVSNAYINAVHSVLTREKSAPEAAAALETELVRITGFKTGPPPQNQHSAGQKL